MMNKYIIIFLAIVLSISSCSEREDELSLLFSKVESIEIRTNEFIFPQVDAVQPLDITVLFFDNNGEQIIFDETVNLEYLVNDQKFEALEIDRSEKQVFQIQVALPNKRKIVSNTLEISVLPVTQVLLDFTDESRNPFAIAGQTAYDFVYRVFVEGDIEIETDFTELRLGSRSYNRVTGVEVTETGILETYLDVFGSKSNSLFISSREDVRYDNRELPLIFHLIHDGDEVGSVQNPSQSAINLELNNLNKAFRNSYGLDQPKSLNDVNSYLRFRMATEDPEGNTLDEPGIVRTQITTDVLELFGNEIYNIMFDQMWDPTRYINIFVCNVDRVTSYAYLPTIYNEFLPGVSNTNDINRPLNYPYAIMLCHPHMGGFVLSHEVGHYLSLLHTFVAFNPGTPCFNSDFVDDTQDYINTTANVFGNYRVDCNGERFLSTNFMDYNNGSTNSFTFDQRTRMRHTYDHALYFPREDLQGGRRIVRPFIKGKPDYTIKPVACEFHDTH